MEQMSIEKNQKIKIFYQNLKNYKLREEARREIQEVTGLKMSTVIQHLIKGRFTYWHVDVVLRILENKLNRQSDKLEKYVG